MTGTGSGSGSLGSASTKGGITRPGEDKPSAVPGAKQKASAAPAVVDEEDESTRLGTKAALESVVEIPVSMASAAELADEGETSLMQFRKTNEASSDDDESRTILVRGRKNK